MIDNLQLRFFANLKIIGLAFIAIIISVIIHYLVPVSFIKNHMSGGKVASYFIAGLLGIITPGPTICIYPIILVLHKKGISYPVLVSYITGQTIIGPARIPYEIGILSVKFLIFRVLTALIIAPLAGILFGLLPGDDKSVVEIGNDSDLIKSKYQDNSGRYHSCRRRAYRHYPHRLPHSR